MASHVGGILKTVFSCILVVYDFVTIGMMMFTMYGILSKSSPYSLVVGGILKYCCMSLV